MKIGLDLDDTIADFFQSLLDYYNKKYNRNDKQEDFKEWKWWPVWGISREEAIRRVDEFHESHNIEEIKPVKGALKAINELSKDNEFFIITTRPMRFKDKSESWIKHHFDKNIKVIHAGDFHKINGANKADICIKLGISLMVEDVGDIALECAQKGIKVILFNKPWNQGAEHKNIIRVNDWKQALEEINNIN
jgi:uncharacterized HAD superfamily protein